CLSRYKCQIFLFLSSWNGLFPCAVACRVSYQSISWSKIGTSSWVSRICSRRRSPVRFSRFQLFLSVLFVFSRTYSAMPAAFPSGTMGRLCVRISQTHGNDETQAPSRGAPGGRYLNNNVPIPVSPESTLRLSAKNAVPFDG